METKSMWKIIITYPPSNNKNKHPILMKFWFLINNWHKI